MTAAIFGLLGVIVGALIQGGWAWAMERRRDDWAARKAGRLLTRAFARSRFMLLAAKDSDEITWGALGLEIGEAMARWPEYADVLAGTLRDHDDWNTIVSAVEALERVEQRGRAATQSEPIDLEHREFLGTTIAEDVWHAAFTASLIGVAGIHSPRFRWFRRLADRIRGRDIEQEARDLVTYSFVVQGETPPPDDDPPATA